MISFVLFLPCLFKENYGIQEKSPVNARNGIEDTINHLNTSTNILDMNFSVSNNAGDEIMGKSVSSLETASSGFGSANADNLGSEDGENQKLPCSSELREIFRFIPKNIMYI